MSSSRRVVYQVAVRFIPARRAHDDALALLNSHGPRAYSRFGALLETRVLSYQSEKTRICEDRWQSPGGESLGHFELSHY